MPIQARTVEEIRAIVLKLLLDIAPEMDPVQIKADKPLRDQVDIDSVDFLRFITKLYEQFGINIPESDYKKLDSVEHMVSYLLEKQIP
jgi:acyl carrier protein